MENPGIITLFGNLMESTKEDLIKIAGVVGAKIKKTGAKATIAKTISDYILANPKKFLSGLMLHELDMVESICEIKNDDEAVCAPLMANQMSLFNLSIMDVYDTEQDNVEMYDLPVDLKKAIENFIDQEIKEQENNIDDLFRDRVILGHLNFIGFSEYYEFLSLVSDITDESTQEIDSYIHRKFLLSANILDLEDGIVIIKSPFLEDSDVDDLFEKIGENECESHCDYKVPFEEIMEWGNMPYPVSHLGYAQKLLKAMGKIPKLAGISDALLTQYWIDVQLSGDENGAVTAMINDAGIKDISVIKKILPELVNFSDKMPLWAFLGHSLEEVMSSHKGKKGKAMILPLNGIKPKNK
jgi:hypothetical protein